MSQVGKQAALLDGIPVVQNATDRDTKYPSPDTNFRVHNLTSGYVEQYDGANWNPVVSTEKGGNQSNVKAYGAKGDGTTDDRGAFASADTAVQAQSVKSSLLIPAGTYKIGTNLTLTSDVVFQPGAQLQPAAGVVVTFNGHVTAPLTQIVTTGAGTLAFAATSVPVYYPQWWGAKGDGTADYGPILSVAFDAMNTAGGGTMRFPPGSYPINTGISKTGYNNIVLQGSGWKTVLSKSTAGDMITWTNANQGLVARDMEVSLGSSAGWAFNLNNCPNSRLQNVQHVGSAATGGLVKGTNNSHSSVVEDCYCGSVIGTAVYFDTSCGGVKIINNRIDGVSQTAGSIGIRASGSGSAHIANTIESVDVSISLQDGAQGLTISGNHSEATNKFIDASGATNSYDVVVIGNSTSEVQTPVQSPCSIDMANCSGWVIQGNYLTAAHSSGAAIRAGSAVSNCIFGPNTKSGDASYVTGSSAATNVRFEGGATVIPVVRNVLTSPTYSASITPDASVAKWHYITVTNASAFTINAPANDTDSSHTQELVFEIYNNSGGVMGTVTFSGGIYVLTGGAWTNPASTKKRWIKFERNANGFYIETGRAANDY